ncbi:MAG TPA: hypothetical protein VJZ71_13025 [Phycisphaerae bacterium]|nr:hypothetical protein [Phycisphaerae bacterium]
MLKRKDKSKSKTESVFGIWAGQLSRAAAEYFRARRRTVWQGVIAGLTFSAVVYGLVRLNDYVHRMDAYDGALALEWVDLPDWLTLPDNQHVLDDLVRAVDLQSTDRMLDAQLATRIGTALAAPEVGWVHAVDRVRIEPTGVVAIKCRFRRPAAWVRHGRYCYLVDGEGVRLPGTYEVDDCRVNALLMVDGVSAAPPNIGQPWPGADLASGLRLSALLADQPFRHQIGSISVANHRGRRDRSRPHIELATDRKGSRIWWGRPPEDDFGTEITASQKLLLLETLYRQWGRIDMNRSYVNIMTWPDRVAMPAVMQSSAQGRLLRG